jgi:hypothetical protein
MQKGEGWCVRARMRLRLRVCARAHTRMSVFSRALSLSLSLSLCLCICMCVCGVCVCVCMCVDDWCCHGGGGPSSRSAASASARTAPSGEVRLAASPSTTRRSASPSAPSALDAYAQLDASGSLNGGQSRRIGLPTALATRAAETRSCTRARMETCDPHPRWAGNRRPSNACART